MTVLEAIGFCQGLTEQAAGSELRILRWKIGKGLEREVITIDIQSMFDSLNFSGDQFLRPKDIIYVPSLGETEGVKEFLVMGEVQNPGFHPHSAGMDILRAVTKAGGVSRHANPSAAKLLRPQESGDYTAVPIDLVVLLSQAEMSLNLNVYPGDILFIPADTYSKTAGQVFVVGAVQHQGPINLPVKGEITLTKAILLAGGGTEFAKLKKVKVHRVSPDGSKRTIDVNVAEILKTGDFEKDLPLQDDDVIVVAEGWMSH